MPHRPRARTCLCANTDPDHQNLSPRPAKPGRMIPQPSYWDTLDRVRCVCTASNPFSRCCDNARTPAATLLPLPRLVTVPGQVRNILLRGRGGSFAARVDVGYCFVPGFGMWQWQVDGVALADVP